MATDTRSILNYQSNDADHRTFAQAIHAMLVAAGLTQTADTGQANLTTITRPTANNVSGYEIFRFDDTEQSTLPIYIKVEYGSGNTNTIPGLKITVGQGTNGAGTLSTTSTAGVSSPWAFSLSAESAGTSRTAWCSYGNGHLVFSWGYNNSTGGAYVLIERPKNYDGSKSTNGIAMLCRGSNGSTTTNPAMEIERAGGGGAAGSFNSSDVFPFGHEMNVQDDIVGADISMLPIPLLVNGNLHWSAALAFRTTAIAADTQQAVTVFGTSRVYRTVTTLISNKDTSVALPYY